MKQKYFWRKEVKLNKLLILKLGRYMLELGKNILFGAKIILKIR